MIQCLRPKSSDRRTKGSEYSIGINNFYNACAARMQKRGATLLMKHFSYQVFFVEFYQQNKYRPNKKPNS